MPHSDVRSRLIILYLSACIIAAVTSQRNASAQIAPVGGYYAGKPTDTGFSGRVNATGGYATSVPLVLPPAKGGIPQPVQIVYGGHGVGAAGLGWDLPLPHLRVDTSIVKRKPKNWPDDPVAGRRRVSVTFGGASMTLVPKGNTGVWVAQSDQGMISASQNGSMWLVYDGQGHEYQFTEPDGYAGKGLWLLKYVNGPSGKMMELSYDVHEKAVTGGNALVLNLKSVEYNFSPSMGCGKDVIQLTYGQEAPEPLSITVIPAVVVRTQTISSVTVKSRSSCASTTVVRRYDLTYAPDTDTGLPRLQSVTVSGRENTPEFSKVLPIAAYHYGAASIKGQLAFAQTATVALPQLPEIDSNGISASVTATLSIPGTGQSYETPQNLLDANGDGRPDLVFKRQGNLWISNNTAATGGSAVLAAPTVIGDTAQHVAGSIEDRRSSYPRYGQGIEPNRENVWRQVIDINGDGRLDIIDAAEQPHKWIVYLNTPGSGPSGVEWRKRAIPTDNIRSRLETYDHTFDDPSRLPLARRFTGSEYWTDDAGDVQGDLLGEYTYTEWELKDVNGDGLPDLVFNTLPVQMQSVAAGSWNHHIPMPGPAANSIEAFFNVGAITLDPDSLSVPRGIFSQPEILTENTPCGVELWRSDFTDDLAGQGSQQLQECTIADITGDGIADRIDHGHGYVGLGAAFSQFEIQLPVPFTGEHWSGQRHQCLGGSGSDIFQSFIVGGLRDLTGDGIADLVVDTDGSKLVYVGTGTGFVSVPLTIVGMGNLSSQHERCDGTEATTFAGVFDFDGDGRADSVAADYGAGRYIVSTLMGGSHPGNPEAGELIGIDNGYGATLTITYRSAKEDTTTSHIVPFPEIVVDSTRIGFSRQSEQPPQAPTSYAYGNASMIYDGVSDAFAFPGYGRTVSLRTSSAAGEAQSEVTVTDALGLAPYTSGSSHAARYERQAVVGRVASVTVLAGSLGDDPWPLLTLDVETDTRQVSRTTYQYASKLVDIAGTGAESFFDCWDYPDPYDFEGSLSDATLGYDTCSVYGFSYVASTAEVRGAPEPSAANVKTRTRTLSVDEYGRVTSVAYDNDVYRDDDDVCVDTTYAAPIGASPPVLIAPATRRVSGCSKHDITFTHDSWEYDNLPVGQVSHAFETSHTVERHATDDGHLVATQRVFDGIYDPAGNLTDSITTRQDGAYLEKTFTYDPFGQVVVGITTVGTGVAVQKASVKADPVTLDPVAYTDANGSTRWIAYDGFERIVSTGFTPPGGSYGVLSTTSYSGFEPGTSGRAISITEFDEPVPPSSLATAIGHTTTTYLDELGRRIRTESQLGADYGQTLVTGYRTYNSWGQVAFEADPYVSTAAPATVYGTSYYYLADGSPNCFIRAQGPTPLTAVSDSSQEKFATCYYHGYSNHVETSGVSDADANLPGSPQAGVLRLQTTTAIGRVLSRSTVQSNSIIEYSTFATDPLGNLLAQTRYRNPSVPSGAVTTAWKYDSAGNILQEKTPEGVAVTNDFDDWGELNTVSWSDAGHQRVIKMDYDAMGRLLHRDEENDGVIDPDTINDFVYDAGAAVSGEVSPTYLLGRLTKASSPWGQSYYSYDEFGHVNATTWFDEQQVRYVEARKVRKDGSPTSMSLYLPDDGYQPELVAYKYDSADRVSQVSYESPNGNVDLYNAKAIDALGRVTDATYGAAEYVAKYGISGRGFIEEAYVKSSYGSRAYAYDGFDPVGREIGRREAKDGGPQSHFADFYDAAGRLARVDVTQGTTSSADWHYQYDALGNVLSANDWISGAGTSASYRAIDEDALCNVGYPSYSGSSCTVSHDTLGNVTEMPTRTGSRKVTYYLSGQSRAITAGAAKASFRYDPFGSLQELDISGASSDNRRDRRYGDLITVHNKVADGTIETSISRSIPGPGGLTASLRGPNSNWVFSFGDGRGLRFTTDAKGKFLQDLSYQPFGTAKSTGASAGQTLYSSEQWNGGDALSALGVSQLGARMYDPDVGRFLSRDPLRIARTAATSNPYAFAANDPINLHDPSGRDWLDGCIGVECQGLQWQNPFGGFSGSSGGGSGGSGPSGTGGNRPPPPPVSPPMVANACEYPDCTDSMWPKFRSAGLFTRMTQTAYSWNQSIDKYAGKAWMYTMSHVQRGAEAAIDFVDAHRGAFVVGGLFVAACFVGPEVLVFDISAGPAIPTGFGILASESGNIEGVASDAAPALDTLVNAVDDLAPRGVRSDLGGVFESEPTPAGGKLWTSTGDISQRDFSTFVNSGMYEGKTVNILTGGHGTPDGNIISDISLYNADYAKFGELNGVNVLDVTQMTADEIRAILNGPDYTIGAFCNSLACLTKFR